MATKYWIGNAPSVAQVTKVAYSIITAGQTYSVTINGKTVSYVATTGVLSDLIDGLINAWGASAEPEHQEMVAAQRLDPTLSGLQLTATQAGVPITVSASATTGVATVTTPTAASGPNFWNVAANWSGGTLPVAADNLIVKDTDVSILYGLTDTTNYASLDVEASFTGDIGLPDRNANGYLEYRTKQLTLGTGSAIAVVIGYGVGTGAGLVRLNTLGSTLTATVHNGPALTGNNYPIEFLTTGTGSVVRVYGGGVKIDSGTSATVTTLDVIRRDSVAQPPQVLTTNAITVTTATVYGGTATIEGPCTNIIAREQATVTTAKATASANVTVSDDAIVNWDSSGNITTKLSVQQGGSIDFGRVGTTKTVQACDLFAGGTLKDPIDKVTFTTGIVLVACRLEDVELDIGVGVTINA